MSSKLAELPEISCRADVVSLQKVTDYLGFKLCVLLDTTHLQLHTGSLSLMVCLSLMHTPTITQMHAPMHESIVSFIA